MDSKTPVEIIIEFNREKKEEEAMETKKHSYGEGCPHTVTDENLGMIFCIKCGIVTEDQIFKPGGGSYIFRRAPTPRKNRVSKKKE